MPVQAGQASKTASQTSPSGPPGFASRDWGGLHLADRVGVGVEVGEERSKGMSKGSAVGSRVGSRVG